VGDELARLLGHVRDLNRRCSEGGEDAFQPFADLASLVLRLTILREGENVVLKRGPNRSHAALQNLRGSDVPLRLRDGRFLKCDASLYVDRESRHLKVAKSRYQYQADADGKQWVFRYDYLRQPGDAYEHPPAHLQVNGSLSAEPAVTDLPLKKIHFASGRVSLEGVIRTIAVQFQAGSNVDPALWHPVLAESEARFHNVAHIPPTGPGA
jgi:hypothetical protein